MASAEEVDQLIRKLERDVERQVATMGSAVKGVAAERDVLGTAEHARDLLGKAVKGEKDSLDRVFGGSCERIGRLRIALDQVTFSDMHANDMRWKHLRDVVETIESVLKDLGTFRPWLPPAARAPERLAYRGLRRRLSPGRRVTLKPEMEGGEAQGFEVEPPLPAGLELSATTGVISGVLQPLALVEEATYTVVGRNAAGEARAELVFCVKDAPPHVVGYPAAARESNHLIAGEEVAWEPEVEGNAPTQWSVEPPLPRGLALDPTSGAIRGAALESSAPRSYVISAANSGGKVTSTLNLEVGLAAPSGLAYPGLPEKLWVGRALDVAPRVGGAPGEWSVEPELPEGLVLDAARGVISGAPAHVADQGSWMVRARNEVGEVSCELAFAVQLAPPAGLAYPGAGPALPLRRRLSLRPTFEGQAEGFSVAPGLPPGLRLDPSTGEISGTPAVEAEEASYEVTARNASGTASVTLTFAVQVAGPVGLGYPSLAPGLALALGEPFEAAVEVEGGATTFTVEPPLPAGLELDEATGTISGAATAVAKEATYTVTASNAAGAVSRTITLAVVPPAPTDLCYPMVSAAYAVGEPMSVGPQLESCFEGTFEIHPALPAGLSFDGATGVISGTPEGVFEQACYRITARNSSGEAHVEVSFGIIETVQSEAVAESINKDFAAKVEAVTDLAEMLPEPSQLKARGAWVCGDWMIWMVHRAYLNDPHLVDFSFNNMHMPAPHIEARIAPKLVKAMETNTHIETLSLVNANLMKGEGVELAAALAVNKTVRTLNLECNCLDSNAVREIASAILRNPESVLEQLRLSPQKQVGTFFGRPVEEAVGMMMDKNNTIIKLGFECNDAHWRNLIDRALLRNNDFARRRRKQGLDGEEADAQAQERTLGRLVLRAPPAAASSEVFADSSPPQLTFRAFVAQQKRLPNATQLQSFAKNAGSPLKYSEVAPLLKECRGRMLDAAVRTEVTVADMFEVDTQGALRSWSALNDNWALEIRTAEGKRFAYKSSKEPQFIVSDEWAEWLGAAR